MRGCVGTYQGPGGSILDVMTRHPHPGKASLGLLAAVAGLGCCVLVVGLATDGIAGGLRDDAVLLAWGAGIVAALLSVLAVQEHTNPDDDPRYLGTILKGLRQEWRR